MINLNCLKIVKIGKPLNGLIKQMKGIYFYIKRFINWMRVSALPNFKKLWGRIDSDM